MPLLNTSGSNTADAYAGGVAAIPNYIENVFSTWLYTGNSSSQTITNGIDLSTYGGLVWCKNRTTATTDNILTATPGKALKSNLTNAEQTTTRIDSFSSTGFFISNVSTDINATSNNYASWTFRKQSKFFDVVTYTGTGSNRTISHALNSTPGCIIVKRTDTTGDWQVYHNGLTSAAYAIQLDLTNAQASAPTMWNSTAPTSTVFSVGTNADVNANGGTYVAYLFAHNAGGFGLTGADNVISCGTFTASASETATVTLGYEPQWLLFKPTSTTGNWQIVDTMRPWPVASDAFSLKPNLSAAEANFGAIKPSATGFFADSNLTANATYIYIAIRRGPMAVPTTGTSVFAPTLFSGNGSSGSYTNSFPTDMIWHQTRNTAGNNHFDYDRLRAINLRLYLNTTDAEGGASFYTINTTQTLVSYSGNASGFNATGETYIDYSFRRAPSFFDEVCYTGTGSATTVNHNLGVVPEMMIVKSRSRGTSEWIVYSSTIGNTQALELDGNYAAFSFTTAWNSTTPTASVFSLGTSPSTNGSYTYVAYLFATCAGVSKVGSYSGTGATQTINCGFTGGARFVLIKRTDFTGDWYVWDTARGMVSGTDPYLLLDTTAAEVNANNVYTTGVGFQIVGTGAGINASGGTYIFLAIS
jgi:hypothetical protein